MPINEPTTTWTGVWPVIFSICFTPTFFSLIISLTVLRSMSTSRLTPKASLTTTVAKPKERRNTEERKPSTKPMLKAIEQTKAECEEGMPPAAKNVPKFGLPERAQKSMNFQI